MVESANATRIFTHDCSTSTQENIKLSTPATVPTPVFSSPYCSPDVEPSRRFCSHTSGRFNDTLSTEEYGTLNDIYDSAVLMWERYAARASLLAEELLIRHICTILPFTNVASVTLEEVTRDGRHEGKILCVTNSDGDTVILGDSTEWKNLDEAEQADALANDIYDLVPTLFTENCTTGHRTHTVPAHRDLRTPR